MGYASGGGGRGIGCHVDDSVEYSPQSEGNRIFEDWRGTSQKGHVPHVGGGHVSKIPQTTGFWRWRKNIPSGLEEKKKKASSGFVGFFLWLGLWSCPFVMLSLSLSKFLDFVFHEFNCFLYFLAIIIKKKKKVTCQWEDTESESYKVTEFSISLPSFVFS